MTDTSSERVNLIKAMAEGRVAPKPEPKLAELPIRVRRGDA